MSAKILCTDCKTTTNDTKRAVIKVAIKVNRSIQSCGESVPVRITVRFSGHHAASKATSK